MFMAVKPTVRRRDVRGRVQAGMKVLDEVKPGWREKIDTRTLDISDGNHCILGQLYGGYGFGKSALGWCDDGTRSRAHGFLACDGLEYILLNEEWKLALNA